MRGEVTYIRAMLLSASGWVGLWTGVTVALLVITALELMQKKLPTRAGMMRARVTRARAWVARRWEHLHTLATSKPRDMAARKEHTLIGSHTRKPSAFRLVMDHPHAHPVKADETMGHAIEIVDASAGTLHYYGTRAELKSLLQGLLDDLEEAK